MKQIPVFIVFILLLDGQAGQGQTPQPFHSWPIRVSLIFHNVTTPFRDMRSNFLHPGVGIGTEIKYNNRARWVQSLDVIWYRNKQMGNGLLAFTQVAWRPGRKDGIYGEIKAGVGYAYMWRPVPGMQLHSGSFTDAGKHGKHMLTAPAGFGIGWNNDPKRSWSNQLLGYQLLLSGPFNPSIPAIPQTIITLGSNINPRKS